MKNYYVRYCFIVFFFFHFNSNAQEILWQNTIGGNDADILYSIEETADGGYILGGKSVSNISGDKTENNWDPDTVWSDYWVVKTDSLGNVQWENTIGGSEDDRLNCIMQTADGGYILGGWSLSGISGDKTEICLGDKDYWIVKIDSLGNIQWQNTIGGSEDDHLQSIKQNSDGGYILGGTSSSDTSGDKTENSKGYYDYWIVKTDSLGNILWQNTIGGNLADQLHSLDQTSDGGYILGGYSLSSSSGDKTEVFLGGFDFWIVKTDSSGNVQWDNTIGGSGSDELWSVEQTLDGGYILGGLSSSDISSDKTENCIGWRDFWIVKTDSLGNLQWQNTIGGNYFEDLYSVHQTSDAGFILGGYSGSNISGDKTENSKGSNDYWIVKTDPFGNIEWQNTIGTGDSDVLTTIGVTADAGFILGGHTDSNISGDKTEDCMGRADYWILKITGKYNLIKGKLFFDANSNTVQDSGEIGLSNKMIKEPGYGRFAFSEQSGQYAVSVLDTGNFTVETNAFSYYSPVPATQSAYFSGIQQTDSLNDFAFQPQGVFDDLCIEITPLGAFRSGFNGSYIINYGNYGTTTLSPTVIFFPYSNVSFVSSSITPASISSDSIVWSLPALSPFQSANIVVTVSVSAGLPIGTLINSSVRIEPVAGDANPACNYHAWEVFTTGSVDPNDILVNEDTMWTTQFPNPPFLEYIIRFQNTGNDTCFNARILNPIDTSRLDMSSFEFVAASHPVQLAWIPWENNLEFRFDNILLPDSAVNEPFSHGFAKYRIRPISTLAAGDSVSNNAAIYFDFNPPVITNHAVTKILMQTTVNQFTVGNGQLAVYPNPASGELNVVSDVIRENGKIKIFDLTGRMVSDILITEKQAAVTLDIRGLAVGVYILELQAEKYLYRAKFAKQ